MWDMSSGYGGRLLGAIVAGVNYVGTDPCTETYEGLQRLAEDYGEGTEIELHKIGSEDFIPKKASGFLLHQPSLF